MFSYQHMCGSQKTTCQSLFSPVGSRDQILVAEPLLTESFCQPYYIYLSGHFFSCINILKISLSKILGVSYHAPQFCPPPRPPYSPSSLLHPPNKRKQSKVTCIDFYRKVLQKSYLLRDSALLWSSAWS